MPQPFVLTGGGLRIAFERVGDRYEHAICWLAQASPTAETPPAIPLLASLAGSADDNWPASPPFTGVHLERRPTGQVAFLVGLAGDSHWSASVELDVAGRLLRFDVACRAGSRPRWLGSTYRLSQTIDGKTAIALPTGAFRPSATLPATLEVDPTAGPARLLQTDAATIVIEPVISPDMVFPGTVRWRYVLRFSAD